MERNLKERKRLANSFHAQYVKNLMDSQHGKVSGTLSAGTVERTTKRNSIIGEKNSD